MALFASKKSNTNYDVDNSVRSVSGYGNILGENVNTLKDVFGDRDLSSSDAKNIPISYVVLVGVGAFILRRVLK